MAEFGASVTEAPQTPNAITPKEGIVKEPIGVQGLANIFGGIREVRAEGRAKKGEAFLSQFNNEQLSIIQAVDQGKMTSQAARTRIRMNLMTAINNYPSLRKELIQSNSSILGAAGMGGIVTDGTKEEIRRENLRNSMVQEGLVSPDASPEEFNQAEQNFILAQESKRRYDAVMDTIGLERAKTGLTRDQLELLKAKEERAATEYLTGTAPALMEQFKNTANKLLSVIGTEGYEEGNVVSLIEERFVEFEQSLSVPLSQTDSHTSQALMKGFREYKDIVIKRAKGEFSQEEYDRRIKRITTQQELVALNDPVLARAVALSNLGLSDLLLSEKLPVMLRAGQFLGDNADEESSAANLFTDTDTGREATKVYLDSISLNPDNLDDEQKTEQLLHLTKIMGGVEDYESFVQKNPESAISMVTDWMSTQKFYNLRENYPEVFENNAAAMRILQSDYGDRVWSMIQKEFNKNEIIQFVSVPHPEGRGQIQTNLTKLVPTPKAVTYQATSNGMEFLAVDKKDTEAVAKAKKLNKELAPIINKNIKAFAHLEGSNNYQQYWEKIDELYMTGGGDQTQVDGGQGEDNLEGGLGNDRLDLQDFLAGQSSLTSEMSTGGYVGNGDYSEANTPLEVASSFIGFKEQEHKQVLSSFIKKAAGTDIDPSVTAWCAAFVNAALGAKGIEGTGKLNAKSFLNWGRPTTNPREGDIAVFDRGSPGSWQGHVGFYVGPSEKKGFVKILGGNQNNTVSIKDYPVAKLEGFRTQ